MSRKKQKIEITEVIDEFDPNYLDLSDLTHHLGWCLERFSNKYHHIWFEQEIHENNDVYFGSTTIKNYIKGSRFETDKEYEKRCGYTPAQSS